LIGGESANEKKQIKAPMREIKKRRMRETKEMANKSGEFFLFPRGRGSVTWRSVVASWRRGAAIGRHFYPEFHSGIQALQPFPSNNNNKHKTTTRRQLGMYDTYDIIGPYVRDLTSPL
jgi:hypothetical protein